QDTAAGMDAELPVETDDRLPAANDFFRHRFLSCREAIMARARVVCTCELFQGRDRVAPERRRDKVRRAKPSARSGGRGREEVGWDGVRSAALAFCPPCTPILKSRTRTEPCPPHPIRPCFASPPSPASWLSDSQIGVKVR